MKKCVKCNNEYKDAYDYCPKCGKPYSNSVKEVKTPGDVSGSAMSFFKKAGVILSYIFGSFMILGGFLASHGFLNGLITVLVGLSFFKVIYTFIGDKYNIDEKTLLIVRIVLPIVLLIIMGITSPMKDSNATVSTKPDKSTVEKDKKDADSQVVDEDEVDDVQPASPTPTTSPSPSPTPSKSSPMDALRKCSVMEAADIYTTGIGQKTDNVFNDGRAACEIMRDSFGETEFIDSVDTDWEDRKDELIDGKPLSYYLGILGW